MTTLRNPADQIDNAEKNIFDGIPTAGLVRLGSLALLYLIVLYSFRRVDACGIIRKGISQKNSIEIKLVAC
jgi:hypothetical protein